MTAPEQDGPPRIALCLSGGGFRASLFHLGVARRLHETGLLGALATFSSVSGGSVFAGFLAGRMIERGWSSLAEIADWAVDVEAPFLELASRDLRTWPVLAHLPWNWLDPDPRARHMARRYRARVSGRRLAELPEAPRFVFLATDLTFGASYVFERRRVGSYRAGYARPGEVTIGDAVSASAAFPPVFGPLRPPVDPAQYRRGAYTGADRDRLRRALRLSDGGVYDNLGLEPALKDHDAVIVSDCGAPFPFRASPLPLLRHLRYPAVIMSQVQSLRVRQLMALLSGRGRRSASGRRTIRGGAYLSLDAAVPGGYPAELVESRITRIRTDLDRFTPAEQRILMNHGYTVAAARLQSAGLGTAAPLRIPWPELMDPGSAAAALERSHRRFSLRRLLGGST